MNTLRKILHFFQPNIRVLFGFEIIYKLIMLTLLLPLGTWMLDTAIHVAGYDYVTTYNQARFLRHPVTILFALISLVLLLLITLLDICAILFIADASSENKQVSLKSVLQFCPGKCRQILRPDRWGFLLATLCFLPFTYAGTAAAVIMLVGLPEFLPNYLTTHPLVLLLIPACMLGLVYIITRQIYSLHFFILDGCSYKEACRRSRQHRTDHGLREILALLTTQVFLFLSLACIILLMILLAALIVFFTTDGTLMYSFYMGSLLFLIGLLAIFYFSLALPITFMVVSLLFYERVDCLELPICHVSKPAEPNLFSGKTRMTLRLFVLASVGYLGFFSYLVSHNRIDFNIEDTKQTQIIAHRGNSFDYPENTMLAFESAADMHADWIELDVQLTKDGVPVILHDPSLKRTAGISGMIWDYTYAELADIDVGSFQSPEFADARIPTLEEVLSFAELHAGGLIIELKNNGHDQGLTEKVIELIREYHMEERCYLSAGVYSTLEEVKSIDPNLKTIYLVTMLFGKLNREAVDAYCIQVDFVSRRLVSRIHRNGKEAMVWTVNSHGNIQKMVNFHVDAIVTNRVSYASGITYSESTTELMQKYLTTLADLFRHPVSRR